MRKEPIIEAKVDSRMHKSNAPEALRSHSAKLGRA